MVPLQRFLLKLIVVPMLIPMTPKCQECIDKYQICMSKVPQETLEYYPFLAIEECKTNVVLCGKRNSCFKEDK